LKAKWAGVLAAVLSIESMHERRDGD